MANKESDFYTVCNEWLIQKKLCEATAINKGLYLGRPDVMGWDGGPQNLYTIEFKFNHFLQGAGQAFVYSICGGNLCYLANRRDGHNPYSTIEIEIAQWLGIGLLAIDLEKNVREILTPKHLKSIEMLRVKLIERLGYCRCTIYGDFYRKGMRH